jgi:lysophospholipase L1-like esterase
MTAAAILFVMVGCFVALWPSGPLASAASGTTRSATGPDVAPLPLRGFDQLIVYGHSMPAGGGASDTDHGYAELAAEATGLELVNYAEGGSAASTAAATMAAAPVAGPRDVVVIHTGMNDIFRRGEEAVTEGRESIQQLLAGTAEAGRRVLVLECQPSSWLDTPPHRDLQAPYDAWNAMLVQEAGAWPDVDVLDTCARWEPLQFTDPPKYHPNDEGHALIAQELDTLLRES